ncbi:hypothetical protein CROQUDRAFT_76833 [Cronartium quercuum f. sp. fusiforme G11]|uniref:Pantothenate kinase n=1 Tax=Cronartium quercuum f. sp. fusiforme G11 TaxID=708437 RepID=A0A9P6NJP3_9BASI|nr:hypothetical protein CROQUDRAFT_76833 [Cronartium quercuum f. sp. fusiforme G11]
MHNRHLPTPTSTLRVDISGAEILDDHDQSVETSDIYLPKHTEYISHIALDIGGSLAKIVYFTRATPAPSAPSGLSTSALGSSSISLAGEPGSASNSAKPSDQTDASQPPSPEAHEPASSPSKSQPNGILIPKVVRDDRVHPNSPINVTTLPANQRPTSVIIPQHPPLSSGSSARQFRPTHRSSVSAIPGGRLNFTKFETEAIETDCIPFIATLIETSAASNGVPIKTMKRAVKIILTGGGAHIYSDRIREALGGEVEVLKEEEMDCLITGLNFITEIPNEVFWFSDELVQEIVQKVPENSTERQEALATTSRISDAIHDSSSQPVLDQPLGQPELPRPSPNPPQYAVYFDSNPTPQFPCMLVNIGSGVSMIKVSAAGAFERISGTSLGGGTLWGLLSLLTPATSFDEMLESSMAGDNSAVDMLVGDIYGTDYEKIGLKSSVIASSFGKVFKMKSKTREGGRKGEFRAQDISKSLLYAISNNIGQIAHLNAEQHGLDRIYFGGCFIRGHAATVSTLSYAIRFWSKGTKRAFFLRHEGYLGSIGAWLKNLDQDLPK